MVRIAVIGAGAIGLSTAYNVKLFDEHLDVTLIADKFSPDTTSDGAAGIFKMNETDVGMANTPKELLRKWGSDTYKWYQEILKTENAPIIGVTNLSGYLLSDKDTVDISLWENIVDSSIDLNKEQMAQFGEDIRSGKHVTSIICEGRKYLPWLLESCPTASSIMIIDLESVNIKTMNPILYRFKEKNGKIVQRKITSFEELAAYDIIVNCSGIGARELCNDENLVPIRGQVLRVKAPWIKHFYHVSYSKRANPYVVYLYPNIDSVVVGGTRQRSWDLNVSEEDRNNIVSAAQNFIPSIKKAEVVNDWVGLRPSRLSSVRIEKEDVSLVASPGNVPRNVKIVHNYGHGPCGITLHWGCAKHALALVKECLVELENENPKSKL